MDKNINPQGEDSLKIITSVALATARYPPSLIGVYARSATGPWESVEAVKVWRDLNSCVFVRLGLGVSSERKY